MNLFTVSRDGSIFLKNLKNGTSRRARSSAGKGTIYINLRYVNKLNPELRKDKLEPEELKALFTYYD